MRFPLKTACKDCPFIKGNILTNGLPRERVKQIFEDINGDKIFPCHKHSKADVACAGALQFMRKVDSLTANAAVRIAVFGGVLKLDDLSSTAAHIFDSEEEMLLAYKEDSE